MKKLKLPTLKYRRHRGDMIEMYKLVSGIYDATTGNFLRLRKDHTTRGTVIKGSLQNAICAKTKTRHQKAQLHSESSHHLEQPPT